MTSCENLDINDNNEGGGGGGGGGGDDDDDDDDDNNNNNLKQKQNRYLNGLDPLIESVESMSKN